MKTLASNIISSQPKAFVNKPGMIKGQAYSAIGRSFTVNKPGKVVTAAASEWVMDKNNSSLEFSAMYMNVVNISGRFNDFDIKVKAKADDFSDAYISLNARAGSVNTGNVLRDAALKSAEWLNAGKFPAITFNSISLSKTEGKNYELTGNITLNGISHTVSFDVVFNGMFTNRDPKTTIAGFTIRGSIDRSKFELGGNDVASGVGYTIYLGANIELVKG